MTELWLGMLGPLRVVSDNGSITVSAGKQRVILAALMVRAGHVVRWDELAEFVWDGTPPKHARVTLRNYVMRLRHALDGTVGARIVTCGPGYLLEAAESEVDAARFFGLCQAGGDALRDGDLRRARETLRDAMELWRGDPLVDVPSDTLRQQEVPRLEQWHLQAWEWLIDTHLHLGCHDELIPELSTLANQHPLRERFHAQLMLALHRSGRQAEAISVYQRIRRRLVDELGVEPGRDLQVVHQRILAGDRALPATTAAGGAPDRRSPPTGIRDSWHSSADDGRSTFPADTQPLRQQLDTLPKPIGNRPRRPTTPQGPRA